MLKIKKICYIFFLFFYFSFFNIYCSLIFPGGINDNKYKIVLGYSTNKRNVKFNNVYTEVISIDIDGNVFKYFDKTYKEYDIDILSNYTFLSLALKPFDKIWYKSNFDIISSQSCKLENSSFLSSLTYGYGAAIGLFYIIFPQTIVTNSIVCKLNIELKYYKFNIFFDDNLVKYKVDAGIFLSETSFGLYAVKMVIKPLEFYFGSDMVYRNSSLTDFTNNLSVFGNETFLKFYLVNEFYLTKNEKFKLNLEYTTKKEYNIFIGYEIGW